MFEYDYGYSIVTTPNGDLIYSVVDPSDERISTTCTSNPYIEIKVYRIITGGTGQFANACGWEEFNGTAELLGFDLTQQPLEPIGAGIAGFQGIQTGEVFFSSDDADPETRGCQ